MPGGRPLTPILGPFSTDADVRAAIRARSEVHSAPDRDAIRSEMREFTEALDEVLDELPEGMVIGVLYRFATMDGDSRGQLGPWRRAALARDDHRCCRCGSTENLQVHHKSPWAEDPARRFDPDNAETLCGDCHAEEHPQQRGLIRAGR